MVKFFRIRGRTLKYYFVVVGFGVVSAFYIYKPIVDVLEQRRKKLELDTAVATISQADGKKVD